MTVHKGDNMKTKTWSDEETQWLIDNYHKLGKKCAQELGRSEDSIWRKAHKLGLKWGEYVDVPVPKKWRRDNHHQWKGCGELSGSYWYAVKSGANARNLDVEVTIEEAWELYENQNRKCALSGLDISFTETVQRKNDTTASLDRIDSSRGYVPGNIQWVHKTVNRMKTDLTQEEFIKFCKLIGEVN